MQCDKWHANFELTNFFTIQVGIFPHSSWHSMWKKKKNIKVLYDASLIVKIMKSDKIKRVLIIILYFWTL